MAGRLRKALTGAAATCVAVGALTASGVVAAAPASASGYAYICSAVDNGCLHTTSVNENFAGITLSDSGNYTNFDIRASLSWDGDTWYQIQQTDRTTASSTPGRAPTS